MSRRRVQATVPPQRLQKFLAAQGIGSRREIERHIEAGRLKIDGTTARLGDKVTGAERIELDGRRLHLNPTDSRRVRVIRYHKAAGKVCTRRDEKGRETVFDDLPKLSRGRWIAIGRLDINTSGLLLFTDNGELANRLMHPRYGVVRVYSSRIMGTASAEALRALKNGVDLEDGRARFESIRDVGGDGLNHWYEVSLAEGRNREVRRLWESQALRVSRLIRVGYGNVGLPRWLRPSKSEALADKEVAALSRLVGLPPEGGERRPEKAQRRR